MYADADESAKENKRKQNEVLKDSGMNERLESLSHDPLLGGLDVTHTVRLSKQAFPRI